MLILNNIDWWEVAKRSSALIGIGAFLWKVYFWVNRYRSHTHLTYKGYIDFTKVENGRYLIRLVGSAHNQKGGHAFIDTIAINNNTLPWLVPEVLHAKISGTEDLFTIRANAFEGAYSSSSVMVGGTTTMLADISSGGNFVVYATSDRKPRRPTKVKLHVPAVGNFAFKIRKVNENEDYKLPPLPSGFMPQMIFRMGPTFE